MNAACCVDEDDALTTLSEDVGGLWVRPVAVLEFPPDPLTFLRDFVHPGVPCIIKNAILSGGANADSKIEGPKLGKHHLHPEGVRHCFVNTASPFTLTLDEVIDHVDEDTKITIDVTPDGHGDCIRVVSVEELQPKQRRMFVKPHEKNVEIGKFRDLLRQGRSRGGGRTSVNGKNNANTEKATPKTHANELDVYPLRHSNCAETCADSVAENFFGETVHPPVVYYSRQNDCLRTELSKLFATKLFPPSFSFAEQAFGTGPPDAINLWIGNEQSVSSMHKDHYENFFYVCSGQKEFILCPPADVVFLEEGEFSSGTFYPIQNGDEVDSALSRPSWIVVADGNDSNQSSNAKTRWIEPDIKEYMENRSNWEENLKGFPLLSKAHPVKVLVSEGEMLYIPSLWFHRVTQTCETVGVNYWYDMKFDRHWCYFNFLQNLRKVKK